MPKVSRRGFLKALGLTGTAAITGCSSESARNLIPFIIPPEDIIPGEVTWYATAAARGYSAQGITALTHRRIPAWAPYPMNAFTHRCICT
jgi:molybdopterin-containing oxidoreductase family iron-sulfur binding subunit